MGEFVFLPQLMRGEDYHQLLESLDGISPARASEGAYTLAIIKPTVRLESDLTQLHPPMVLTKHAPTDETALTLRLMQEMPNNLTPKLCFSLKMDPEDVDVFYGERVKTSQINVPPIDQHRYGEVYQNRWDEFLDWITREPSTFIILEDAKPTPQDNAVTKWLDAVGRGKLRSWDVGEIKKILPNSLRGRFARDNHNNIFHASASPEEFVREIDCLRRMIERRRIAV